VPSNLLSGAYLYRQNEYLITLAALALFLIATEIGFRRGRAIKDELADIARSQLSTLQGAVIGLLALLLAFSFAMAESRFETRQSLVVGEANSIGTACLRAQLLPDPYRNEILNSLRGYLDDRIDYIRAEFDQVKLDQVIAQSATERTILWTEAAAAVQKNPNSPIYALFISSLNDVFDLATKRDAAEKNHVPEIVLYLLFGVGAVAMGLVGIGTGVGDRRHPALTMSVAVLIALVIMVIMDLDRPRRGLIEVSQHSMINLRDSLR
jgi:hypothetical protein